MRDHSINKGRKQINDQGVRLSPTVKERALGVNFLTGIEIDALGDSFQVWSCKTSLIKFNLSSPLELLTEGHNFQRGAVLERGGNFCPRNIR